MTKPTINGHNVATTVSRVVDALPPQPKKKKTAEPDPETKTEDVQVLVDRVKQLEEQIAKLSAKPAEPPPTTALSSLTLDGSDPAQASLVRKLFNANKPAAGKFFLVVMPDDEWAHCEEFALVDELVARLKDLLGTATGSSPRRCKVFPFMGQKLTLTQGPHRYLSTPYGHIPLFDVPEMNSLAEDEAGWIGEVAIGDETATEEEDENS